MPFAVLFKSLALCRRESRSYEVIGHPSRPGTPLLARDSRGVDGSGVVPSARSCVFVGSILWFCRVEEKKEILFYLSKQQRREIVTGLVSRSTGKGSRRSWAELSRRGSKIRGRPPCPHALKSVIAMGFDPTLILNDPAGAVLIPDPRYWALRHQ